MAADLLTAVHRSPSTLSRLGLRLGEPIRFRRNDKGRWIIGRVSGVAADGSVTLRDPTDLPVVRAPSGSRSAAWDSVAGLRWQIVSDVAITWEQLELFDQPDSPEPQTTVRRDDVRTSAAHVVQAFDGVDAQAVRGALDFHGEVEHVEACGEFDVGGIACSGPSESVRVASSVARSSAATAPASTDSPRRSRSIVAAVSTSSDPGRSGRSGEPPSDDVRRPPRPAMSTARAVS